MRSAPMPCGREMSCGRRPTGRRPGAAVGADSGPRHRFAATADGRIGCACHDLRRSVVDGLEGRCAEAMHLLPRDALGVPGKADGGTRNVAALLAHRLGTPRMTSSTSAVSSSRALGEPSICADSWTALISCSEPSGRPRPRGVRTWS